MSDPYGKHLSFPFRIAADGKSAQVSSLESHVRDELIQLILTNQGERLFLPQFGGGVRRLIFEGADETAAGITRASLTKAISRWLGHRLQLVDLSVVSNQETIEIEIRYRTAGVEETKVIRFQRNGEAPWP